MNRFTVIVMSDSREDADSVVHAVSALSRDKEAENEQVIAQLAGEREYAAQAAAAGERESIRRSISIVKIEGLVEPGETKTIKGYSRQVFAAAGFRVTGKNAHHFSIEEIRYGKLGDFTCPHRVDFKASSAGVPAAAFAEGNSTGLSLNFDCAALEIEVTNASKRPRTFHAYVFGFIIATPPPPPPSWAPPLGTIGSGEAYPPPPIYPAYGFSTDFFSSK